MWTRAYGGRLTRNGSSERPRNSTTFLLLSCILISLKALSPRLVFFPTCPPSLCSALSLQASSRLCLLVTTVVLAAKRATFQLGRSYIDLLTPTGEGLVQQVLTELGEGLLEVSLAVNDLQQARSFLRQSGIDFEPDVAGPRMLLISPHHALGARLVLVEEG